MSPENFCYWLQGFCEISRAKTIDAQQVQEIKNHLKLVLENEESQYYQIIMADYKKSGIRFATNISSLPSGFGPNGTVYC